MSLTNGTITLMRYLALGPVPDEPSIADSLREAAYTPFQSGMEEERSGTCDWRNMLFTPDKDWAFQDGKAFFGIRVDTRKIPAALLNAHVDLKLETLRSNGSAFIGKEARLSIKDEVKAELLPKQSPTTKVIEVCWDLKKGMIYTSATSKKTESFLRALMATAFGIDLAPLTPSNLAAQYRPPDLAMEEVAAGQTPEAVDNILGPLYLTWLWRVSLTEGGANLSQDDGTALFFGDSITLQSDEGMVKEATLKKGEPVESMEAFVALTKGMRPTAAKLNLKRGDLDWTFSLKAGTLLPGSMKVPPSDAKDLLGILADRLGLFEEAMTSLDDRYKAFLIELVDGGIEGLQGRLHDWAKEARDAFVDVEAEDDERANDDSRVDAPWEA